MKPLFKLSALALLTSTGYAAATEQKDSFEHIEIFGSAQAIDTTPGSGAYLSETDLEKFEYSDVMRALQAVPGIYVIEEDGYGLRPNIGMRGTGSNRSSKITVMEDGVLAAPAPYSAPAAYYFPTFGRMQSVEVLKGSSSVKYGPMSTGGVLNLISRQIPEEKIAGELDLGVGSDDYRKVHGFVGGEQGGFGNLLEVFHYAADGFKQLPSGQDTGFEKTDLLGKTRYSFGQKDAHTLGLKVQYSEEDSNETYMGITDADFQSSPYRRYAASQLDNMKTDHTLIQVDYSYQINTDMQLSASAYHIDFHRNWYKLSGLSEQAGVKKALNTETLLAASAFDRGLGFSDTLYIDVKANNRDYLSRGLQTQLTVNAGSHAMTFGARYHEDEVDRFQWVDEYTMDRSFNMTKTKAGQPGSNANRVESATAVALFAHDEWSIGDLTVSGGLRYESMTLRKDDWGKDISRSSAPSKVKRNEVEVIIPSIGATYQLNDSWVILAGLQRGFAPPKADAGAKAEKSWNFETGFRYNEGNFQLDLIGFVSEYNNMLGACTAAQGCTDEIGKQYNAGEVDIQGVELNSQYQVEVGAFQIPLGLAYTYTEAEFQNNFKSKLDTWGNVEAGDALPYVPEHQVSMSVGLNIDNFSSELAMRYRSEMRTRAGHGAIADDERIEDHVVVDMGGQYAFATAHSVYLTIDNLLDEKYMASRLHAGGIQPGKPRTFQLGYRFKF
ncbi:TonB-dependent receptor family protein [Algicola sagamiensis]|uniref:TonB-dependent receptor family protein n=1 Tax=Algicola sagamiensis TaxID=163869 RepID=UPI0003640D11|nr:TonB-dependent receptor [Algicola sagamiensis]